jgi:UDP-glucose 4-epimerase
MRILLTGGCGFIGCHLASKLLGAGNETVILDNLENSKKENLPPNAEFIKGDIRDPSDIARAMKGCEAIFHLAAVANIRGEDRAGYEVNFLGAKKIFEQAKRIGIKVIFSSSAAVYGNIAACREDSECKPVSQYGISKLKAENFLRKEMPDAFIARLFNVYGSGGKISLRGTSRVTDPSRFLETGCRQGILCTSMTQLMPCFWA